MKKAVFIFVFLISLTFCSCAGGADMTQLLSYQPKDFTARINVSGDGEFSAELKKTGELIAMEMLSPDEISGVVYELSGGELFIKAGDVKIKLDGEAEKPMTVFSCFALAADSGWKISSEKLGGAAIYKCVSSDATVYFDKTSLCPYRFEKNGLKIDVLSFEVINHGGAE